MGHKSDTPDSRVARIAARQHGVVTLGQLEAVGLGRDAIYKRARRGRLHRLHRGVYAVGHRAHTHHSRWMAAVLACGEGAVLSHHSATALWELLRPIEGPIHVSVPTTTGRTSRRGIHLHRCPSLDDPPSSPPSPAIRGGRGRGITRRHRIPVTSIQRTIDDLEGTVPPYLLRRGRRQAELKGIHLEGVERKRQRSDLEEDFLALFLQRRFPVSRDQRQTGPLGGRLPLACTEPRLRSRGFTVLRFADTQLEDEPDRVAADVARALAGA